MRLTSTCIDKLVKNMLHHLEKFYDDDDDVFRFCGLQQS